VLLDTAQALTAAGCCVIPVRPDGTKAPAARWEKYQHHLPAPDDLQGWFTGGRFDGLGVVCGAISGGLEMFEVEGRAVALVPELAQILADNGAAELWQRLSSGYLEQSPSGGFHWLYRVVDGPARGNTKLARRPATAAELEENPKDRVKVLIETRGEGGFVVVAPSAGRTHDTGAAWRMIAGGPASIPAVTSDERDLLYLAASLLDAMPAADPGPAPSSSSPGPAPAYDGELRPGDDFNARASWDDILAPHGWRRTRKNFAGNGSAWTRPGKQHGVSATTGTSSDGVDRLYVFSSSTDFEPEQPYSKFAAYAHLNHGGDMAAAASQLRHDGYGAPLEEPRPALTFTGPPAGHTGPTAGPPSPPPPPVSQPSHYTLTDDGNALRLVDRHGEQLRYVPQRGLWLRWAGHRWAWDEAETVRELARGVARDLPDHTKALQAHRARSLQNGAITAQVRLAQTDARIVTHVAHLDAHPFQLNTPGGVVDLRTGLLSAPDPAMLHTRSTNVAPDPDAPCPRWERFLADTFAGDPELTTYVQRLLGVSLIGQVLEQILPFALGAGANGKTTLLGAIQRIIGIGDTGYAVSAPAEILLATRNTDHPATIAQLAGARVVVTSELEEGQHFAEARVKQLTGRDAINARFMRQNPFTFTPTHTLWLLANHQPSVKAGGPAFWRRIAMLPFAHTVPVDQRDPHLEDRLVDDEGPAILAWCVAGARDYLAHGLALPASVKEATQAYERDQDTIARFVDDMCETGAHTLPNLRTKVAEIRAAYESWCHVEGETPVNAKAFTQALRTRYSVYSERDRTARWYAGIRLVDPSFEPAWPASTEGTLNLSRDVSQGPDEAPATEWWQR
jgi:putative DNA primase/helicase